MFSKTYETRLDLKGFLAIIRYANYVSLLNMLAYSSYNLEQD